MVKIYKQPFAHEGDAVAIPDASQPDGKMSSADGWTPDYQLKKTEPNYKPVGRQELNGVFKEVTEALGQVQVQGAASWSPDGAPYPINAQVYHSGKQWLALRANSVEPAEGEDWSSIKRTATLDAGSTPGTVMLFGAFGFNGGKAIAAANANNTTPSGVYSYNDGVNTPFPKCQIIRTKYEYEDWNIDLAFNVGYSEMSFRSIREDQTLNSDWAAVITSLNLLQAAGNSTIYPMSQKAVTDAIAAVAGVGIDQSWQDFTASRFRNTAYTNTSGKPIFVSVFCTGSGLPESELIVDGIVVDRLDDSNAQINKSMQGIVPNGSVYQCNNATNLVHWMELR